MTVTFQTKLEDWEAFSRAVKLSRWSAVRLPFLMMLLMILIPMVTPLFHPAFYRNLRLMGWRTMLGIYGTSSVVQWLIPLVFLVVFLGVEKTLLQKSPLLTVPITLVADDESIQQTNGKNRDTLMWSRVHGILETDAHFFVLRARKAGLIIPKRAFESPVQCAEFGALLKRKWAEHHPDVAPIARPR